VNKIKENFYIFRWSLCCILSK